MSFHKYEFFILLSNEYINPKITNKTKKFVNIIFFKFFLMKKIKINTVKNENNGILFPESRMPTPKIHITKVININLKSFLFLSTKTRKSIERKEKFSIKPPAINSSPKNPEL